MKCSQVSQCDKSKGCTERTANSSILQFILSNDPNPTLGVGAVPFHGTTSSPCVQSFIVSAPLSHSSKHYSSSHAVPYSDGLISFVQDSSSVHSEGQPPSLSVNWYDMLISSALMSHPVSMVNDPSQMQLLNPSSLLPLQHFCTDFPFLANPPQVSIKRLFDMASSTVFKVGDVQRQLCWAINGFVELL